MAREFTLTPHEVPRVETGLRRIVTPLPAPASLDVLAALRRHEPRAMQGQPPIVWDRAEGFQVYDNSGNCWIDWSSGVLITNAGHGRREIRDAIAAHANSGLLATYAFANETRARLLSRLSGLLPPELNRIFLLTTGSETVECAIKLSRMHGLQSGGRGKKVIVSFQDAFHGRTLGAQQAGGIPDLKTWIGNLDAAFVQVPFPDGYRNTEVSFDAFLRRLQEQGVEANTIAGVVAETYQGGSAAFADKTFMKALRQWCTGHKIVLTLDEVQAGFGRTGTMWGFEHYGIVPDLALFGKGISSSLPVAAVAGAASIMDLAAPGTMSSTHGGNPVCCAAALASIDLIVKEGLVDAARSQGAFLHERLRAIKDRFPCIGAVLGLGLVAGVHCVRPGTKDPDANLAWTVVERCFEKGLLMFAPVGPGGATVKICPPLNISREAIDESTAVFEEAVAECVAARSREAHAS